MMSFESKMLKIQVVLVLVSASVCFAAVAIHPLEDKPDKFKNEEGCYISELDTVVPYGGSAPSKKECLTYHCNEDSYRIFTCGVLKLDESCSTMSDLEKPYPDCCPKPICPKHK